MLGYNRWHLLKGLAAILCIMGIVSLALTYFFSRTAVDDYNGRGFQGRFLRAFGRAL